MLVKDYTLNRSEFALLIELMDFWQKAHRPYLGCDLDEYQVDRLRQSLQVQDSIQVFRSIDDRP